MTASRRELTRRGRRARPTLEVCESRTLLSIAVVPPAGPQLENPDADVVVPFRVSIDPSLELPVTVNLSTAGTTGVPGVAPAVYGRDYAFAPGQPTSFTFLPNDPTFSRTVNVSILGSYLIKPTVGFTVTAVRTDTNESASGAGTVTNLNSTVVSNVGSTGYGSFFGAVSSSNVTPGFQPVTFNLPVGGTTITPTKPLPAVTDPTSIIDGGRTVVLDGRNAGPGASGLVVIAGGVTVRGLTIADFSGIGVVLDVNGGDVLDGDAVRNVGLSGIVIQPASKGNAVTSNTVAGAGGAGIQVDGSTGNAIAGNTVAGAALSDIFLNPGSDGNTVAGNTAVGSVQSGLWVSGSQNNTIIGNTLGGPLDAQRNGQDGMTLIDSSFNRIDRNTVQGNDVVGIRLVGGGSNGNTLTGNVVGVGPGVATGRGNHLANGSPGPTGQGNLFGGIFVHGGSANVIGGTTPAEGNLVSGNGGPGIQITGGASNAVIGNTVGLDSSGRLFAGNALDGIYLDRSPSNVVVGNVSSGNGLTGVRIYGQAARGNTVLGNKIGTNAAGDAALGNAYDGVFLLLGANGNTIGGAGHGQGNVISGNGGTGIQLYGPSPDAVTGNLIVGNFIGTNAAGLAALGNAQDGVFFNQAAGNTLGTPGGGNVISGNRGSGVQLMGRVTAGNLVQSNRIGQNVQGRPLGNFVGVFVNGAGANTVVTSGPTANTLTGNQFPVVPIGTTLSGQGPAGPLAVKARRRGPNG